MGDLHLLVKANEDHPPAIPDFIRAPILFLPDTSNWTSSAMPDFIRARILVIPDTSKWRSPTIPDFIRARIKWIILPTTVDSDKNAPSRHLIIRE